MQIRREEVRTGLLVLISIAIITGVLLAIGAPGVFNQMNTYHIFFDDAGGLKLGAQVLLAGRKIGQVTQLLSPVPMEDRPKNFRNYEAIVEVQVERHAQIFREVRVRMLSYSLLGEQIIDFTSGQEKSGPAPDGAYFIGERDKGFSQAISEAVDVVKNVVTPLAQQATATMQQLDETADNLKKMTAPGSNIETAVSRFREFGDNLVELSGSNGSLARSLNNIELLTGPDGHLNIALTNIDRITNDLAKSKDIDNSLRNLRQASQKLNSTVDDLGPSFEQIGSNLEQFSDTVKHQPWRLIWPSTKRYPEENRVQPLERQRPSQQQLPTQERTQPPVRREVNRMY